MKITQSFSISAHKDFFHEVDSIRTAGLFYLSWIQINEYSKLLPLSRFSDSLKHIIESSKGFVKDKTAFTTILSDERDFMDEFSFLFSQSVLSAIPEITNAETWNQKTTMINGLRNNKNAYKKLSGERLFDFSWRLCIEQYNWLMQSRQYTQAYKAATLLSFINVIFLKPEFLMARAAAGNKDKEKCLKHLIASVAKEKLTRENILNDGLITNLLSENDVERIFNE
jgi:hypothetical protein